MLFNSLEYLLFLPLTFFIYWFILGKRLRLQNIFLLLASYVFYGWWDSRFLLLLLFSTSLDYFTAIRMSQAESVKAKKFWFWLSVSANLGFLGFFKYYNFFISSFAEALTSLGFQANMWTLQIILPVGISFYTFHGLSYVIDVYNERIKPTTNFVDYAVFVSFFPLLVAGPIERATHLLPQIQRARTFTYEKGVNGLRLILWGLFKKVVVADNCAIFVNAAFAQYENASSSELILACVFFAFQIYGDFSGYSDIARGTAQLLGIELLTNFRTPYFARDIAEFWRRWHISLTTWFRDYLYIPLGGSKSGKWAAVRNTMIIFLVSGFWHGANWTFIVWGLINGLYFLPLLLAGRNRQNLDTVAEGRLLPNIREIAMMIGTFLLTCFAWIFFRSESLAKAFDYMHHIIYPGKGYPIKGVSVGTLFFFCFVLVVFDWMFRSYGVPFENWEQSRLKRYLSYAVVAALILFYGAYVNPQSFIYFQF